MTLQWTLALRYLRGRRTRSLLSITAVVFGVMILFGMNGIVPAVRASFDDSIRIAAHTVDLLITPATERTFGADSVALVGTTPGVARATGVLEHTAPLPAALQIQTRDGHPLDRLVISGWEPEGSQASIPIQLVAGRWLAAGDTATALVRQSLLDRTDLRIGDTLQLPLADGSVPFTIVGVLPARPVIGDEEVSIPLSAAQALFGQPDQVNAIAAQFAPDADGAQVRAAVQARLGTGFRLGEVDAGGNEWAAVLVVAEIVFTMFGVLALAMGGLIIFNTFRISVAERRRDIGLLRAVGASRRTIFGAVIIESLVLGAVGTAIGMLIGAAGVAALLPLLSPQWARYFGAPLGAPVFSPPLYAVTIGLGLGIPLLSGLLPALTASRVLPLAALQPPPLDQRLHGRGKRLIGGSVLVGLALISLVSGNTRLGALGALLFLGGLMLLSAVVVQPVAGLLGRGIAALFPSEGQIAQRNLTRQPERAAVTVAAMLTSVAILVALAGLATTFTTGLMGYLERSMRADYLLLPETLVLGQSRVSAGPALAEQVRSTPGIAAITTLRRAESRVAGTPVQLIGIDPVTYPDLAGLLFTAGAPEEAFPQLGAGRFVIVNGMLAAQHGLGVGDAITLETGQGPQHYAVVGIGVDYLNSRVATAYVSHATLAADWGIADDVLLMANRERSAEPDAVERALVDVVRAYPGFGLLRYATWRAEQQAANQTRTNILYLLMAILAVPSLLALANTLSISVVERTREIGMLRAIGGSRAQLQRMIVAESLLLAALGTLFGILGGIWLGYALVGAMRGIGLPFAYRVPGLGIGGAVVVGLAFGVLAALLPARRATRLPIIAALRYE